MIEYLDRMQQSNKLMLTDATKGTSRVLFEDTDKAWVDVSPLSWIGSAAEPDLLWLSERDGWLHAWRVDRHTGQTRLLTKFEGDVIAVEGVDLKGGWLYFEASPQEPLRAYLYRARLDGQGSPERLTPADQPGTHAYNIAPDGRWAVHTMSTFSQPNHIEVVSLPEHKAMRTLVGNEELAAKAKALLPTQPEFFTVAVANGVTLDGWMIKPPNFDATKKYPVLTYVYGEPANATVRDSWADCATCFTR